MSNGIVLFHQTSQREILSTIRRFLLPDEADTYTFFAINLHSGKFVPTDELGEPALF